MLRDENFVIEEQKTSFFLGRETIVSTRKPGMGRWREHLFIAMSHHAQRPAEFSSSLSTARSSWAGASKFSSFSMMIRALIFDLTLPRCGT
jgi:hypothetical protein